MSRSKMRVVVGIAWAINTNIFAVVWIGTGEYRAFAQDNAAVFVVANVLLFLLSAFVVGRIVQEWILQFGMRRALAGLGSVLLVADALSGLALATIE